MFDIGALTGRWRVGAKSEPVGVSGEIDCLSDERRLVAALLDEFVRSASLSVTVTSVINALAERRTVRLFGSLNIYMPAEPAIFSALGANLVSSTLDDGIIQDLEVYYAAARVTALKTMEVCHGLRTVRLATGVDWLARRRDWRLVCGLAGAVRIGRLVCKVPADTAQFDRVAFLQDSSRAARDGNSPSVSSDGTILVPGLVDRRRDKRLKVGRPVWIESNAGRQHATLQDISASGMGLAFCRGLQPGMPVTVAMPDGRRLLGIAVWASTGRAGVRFVSPLSESDPLLKIASL